MPNDENEPDREKRSLRPVMLGMVIVAAAISLIFGILVILGAILTAASESSEKIVGAIYLPSDLSEGQVAIILGGYVAVLAYVLSFVLHHVRTPTHRLQLAAWGVAFMSLPVAVFFVPVTGQELTWSGSGLLSYSYYVDVDCGSWFRRYSGIDTGACQSEFESISRIAMVIAAIGIVGPVALLAWEAIKEKHEERGSNP